MAEVLLSSKGQIVLPSGVRKALGLNEGDRLNVDLEGDHITICRVTSPVSGNWRRWRGRLAGTRALQDHTKEHAKEVKSERLS